MKPVLMAMMPEGPCVGPDAPQLGALVTFRPIAKNKPTIGALGLFHLFVQQINHQRMLAFVIPTATQDLEESAQCVGKSAHLAIQILVFPASAQQIPLTKNGIKGPQLAEYQIKGHAILAKEMTVLLVGKIEDAKLEIMDTIIILGDVELILPSAGMAQLDAKMIVIEPGYQG
jgi:hypothetical protein